uniref:Uncharacterized protein n=1 Tax=Romanomermis culicivorax TaxID=13658 RepID=A0A915IF99_ROMCU
MLLNKLLDKQNEEMEIMIDRQQRAVYLDGSDIINFQLDQKVECLRNRALNHLGHYISNLDFEPQFLSLIGEYNVGIYFI